MKLTRFMARVSPSHVTLPGKLAQGEKNSKWSKKRDQKREQEKSQGPNTENNTTNNTKKVRDQKGSRTKKGSS